MVVRVLSLRAHVVSLVAVFLALALGVLVGTTALNGPVLDDLEDRVRALSGDKAALEGRLAAAREQTQAQEQATASLSPVVTAGRLTGQRVVVLSTPDAPGRLREELLPVLRAAGARVTGSVRLRPALLDQANRQQLDDLVAQVAVPGADLPEGEPLDRAVAQLAQVLVSSAAAPDADVTGRVLGAYAGQGLVDVEGDVAPATLAVLLTGDTRADVAEQDGEARDRALLGLVRGLDLGSSGAVVAGLPGSAGEDGLLGALRADGAMTDRVSSVDAADTPTGRLAVVLALQEQRGGGSGAYGYGPGSDAALPAVAAAPARRPAGA